MSDIRRVALVTGAAKGIGAAVCRRLAADGFSVAVNYNTSADEAAALVNELKKITDAEAFRADVSDSKQVNEMVNAVTARFGRTDALVNNAGIAQQVLFTDISDAMWQRMLGVNLTGQFNCCRAVLPQMINRKSGKIVNITSMWGEVGASMEVHYSAAKAGVIGLTKALAKEVGLSGITVNAVSPGVIMTDMMAGFSPETVDALRDETPLNTLGMPDDVANAVAFLLSEKADFITGTVLPVNGGFTV